MVDHNQTNLHGLVALIIEILKMILLIEFIGALILGFHFLHYYSDWKEAFLHGLFASISATTNAGLDITGASMVPYADDYFVQFITILLLTLGSIGFPVLIEVKNYLFHKNEFHTSISFFTIYKANNHDLCSPSFLWNFIHHFVGISAFF